MRVSFENSNIAVFVMLSYAICGCPHFRSAAHGKYGWYGVLHVVPPSTDRRMRSVELVKSLQTRPVSRNLHLQQRLDNLTDKHSCAEKCAIRIKLKERVGHWLDIYKIEGMRTVNVQFDVAFIENHTHTHTHLHLINGAKECQQFVPCLASTTARRTGSGDGTNNREGIR